MVLLVVAGLLVVALVVAIVTLRSALEGVIPAEEAVTATDVEVDIPDCTDQFPEWIDGLVESESSRIVQLYGTGPVTASAYRHPDDFPTVAVTWAGVVPNCGTTLVIPGDIGVAYYLDATTSSRSQFEALSSVLTALGFVMTADQGPRDLLEVDAGEPVGGESPVTPTEAPAVDGPVEGDSAESDTSAYRSFRLPDGTRMWVQFDPVDPAAPDGDGDLYLGYFPAT